MVYNLTKLACLIAMYCFLTQNLHAAKIEGHNDQLTNIKGNVSNISNHSKKAQTNVSSIKGKNIRISGNNKQHSLINGYLHNSSAGLNSTAKINIASINSDNVTIQGENSQLVMINGIIYNKALNSSQAEINIGSITGHGIYGSNQQTIVINKSILNLSKGGVSKLNIGNKTYPNGTTKQSILIDESVTSKSSSNKDYSAINIGSSE